MLAVADANLPVWWIVALAPVVRHERCGACRVRALERRRIMKKASTLKTGDLKNAKRLPRAIHETELKSLAGGLIACQGGTSTFCNDCDE